MSENKPFGVDVSEFQGALDWPRLRQQGVKFAIVRAGFGSSLSQKDKMFQSHLEGALASGMQVGAYWFGYAYTVDGAKKEADICAQVLKPYQDKITLPVFYDCEYDSMRYAQSMGTTPNKTLITDMTIAFMERMKEQGYKAGYYTNLDYIKNKYEYSRIKGYDLWMAYYNEEKPPYDCAVQQYTSTGRLNGCGGNLDLNRLYKDYGKPAEPKPEAPAGPAEPAQAETVYTVQKGDTLSAIGAKYHTTYQVLAAYNKIENPSLIYPGQKIKIPGVAGSAPAPKKVYIVQAGDTLSGIAAKFGTTYQDLAAKNGISNPNLIYPGQKIKIS